MNCPHCGKEIVSAPKGVMRGGPTLMALVMWLNGKEPGTRLTAQFACLMTRGETKEVYNALGYLTRHGTLVRVGYGQYAKA